MIVTLFGLALLGGCVAHETVGTRNLACAYAPDCYYAPVAGTYYAAGYGR